MERIFVFFTFTLLEIKILYYLYFNLKYNQIIIIDYIKLLRIHIMYFSF